MRTLGLVLLSLSLFVACKKKDEDDGKKLTIQPQIVKLPTGDTSLSANAFKLVSNDGAIAQSFTPTSIKLSVYAIMIGQGDPEDWNGTFAPIYTCPYSTNEECLLEVSNLTELEDALNASPVEVAEGTYTKVQVTYCAVPGTKQLIEVTGSTVIGGTTYITNTENGVIVGNAADATPVRFSFSGCGSKIPLETPITSETVVEQAAEGEDGAEQIEKTTAQVSLRLLFDTRDFAMIGNAVNTSTIELFAGHTTNADATDFNQDDSSCKGSKTGLFLCTERTALYPTDNASPRIERYSIALRDTEAYDSKDLVAEPSPLVYTAVVLKDDGQPIAAYTRRSVNQGATFNKPLKGDENYLSGVGIVDNGDGSFKFSEGPAGEQLSYGAFRFEDHEGTRNDISGNSVAYKAVKMN